MRKGQAQTQESRAKISEGMRGKGKSASTREKMALARTAYWARRRNKARYAQELAKNLLDEGDIKSETVSFKGK